MRSVVIYKEFGSDDGFIVRTFFMKRPEKGERYGPGAEWQAKDIARILHTARRLLVPTKQMWIDYDAEADVLYLSFCMPQRATDSEVRDDGIIVHRRGKKVVGLSIQDAWRR